ncbi:MAG: DUF1501 domain-containing protein, partial [Pyrinomonadaceae bacterium]
MSSTRRDFLRTTACALGGMAMASTIENFGLVGALAQEAAATDYRALVCIFLNGGNDGNNMIVSLDQYNGPAGSTTTGYSNVRNPAGLALTQASLLPVAPASGGSYGFHPNMPELQSLFTQGKLAAVCNVGPLVEPLSRATYQSGTGKRPLQLFSHSDQVGEWLTSAADTSSQTGWGGRAADRAAGLNGAATFPQIISIAGVNVFVTGLNTRPLAINDSNTSLSTVLPLTMTGTSSEIASRRAAFDQIRSLDLGARLVKVASDTRSSSLQTGAALATVSPTIITLFPNTSLGRQLLQVARLIKASNDQTAGINMKRQIFFVSLGGFDSHSSQRSAGSQDGLLIQVSQAMNAFYNATVELGVANNVTSFTLSDFGRTFQPAGSGAGVGSDHGWGSHH